MARRAAIRAAHELNLTELMPLSTYSNQISMELPSTKRLFDVVLAIFGILFLLPLLIGIALVVRFTSRGPITYRGWRVGMGGTLFPILKFRTMCATPESHQGPRVTGRDDPRITRLGRFLRNTKLNELPQLLNVLRGEMSFVGPRPEDPSFVKFYTEEQREVLSVKPGITSLAAVLYVHEEKMLQGDNVSEHYIRNILPLKLDLDLLYVRNQSLLLDLDILFRTLLVLVPWFRKRIPKKEDMLLGPVRRFGRHLGWRSREWVPIAPKNGESEKILVVGSRHNGTHAEPQPSGKNGQKLEHGGHNGKDRGAGSIVARASRLRVLRGTGRFTGTGRGQGTGTGKT